MSDKTSSSRAEQVRERRRSTPRRTVQPRTHASDTPIPAYRPKNSYLPGDAHTIKNARVMRASNAVRQGQGTFVKGGTARRTPARHDRGGKVGIGFGRTEVRAPALGLPQLGPRWISGGMTLVLVFLLYAMSTASTFSVSAASVRGNERLTSEDISKQMEVVGEPIYKVIPAQVEQQLRTAFPDLKTIKVSVSLPNKVSVSVVERQPLLAWYQGEAVTWIDASGVAFMPRGDVPGLIQVSASSNPPKLPEDPNKGPYEQVFLSPDMVNAFVALAPSVPAGVTMTYSPEYGAGWQDPRGWSVYFGSDMKQMDMKLKVYNAIVDDLTKKGIQPTLISVAYLDAPIYK